MPKLRSSSTKSLSHDGSHISDVNSSKGGARSKKAGSVSSASPFNFLITDEEQSPCKICTKYVGKEKAISCDRCNAWVHMKCSELDPSDYGLLAKIQAASVKWHCPVCIKETQKLPDPDDRQAQNAAKLDTLTQILFALQQQNQLILELLKKSDEKMVETVKQQVRETYEEDKDREARKMNLIMYNVKESKQDGEMGENEDKLIAFNVFHDVDSNLKPAQLEESVVEVVRLGKKSEKPSKPRPMKIVFKNMDMKQRIQRKAKNLKKSESYNTVGISADKTRQEREQDKVLVAERNKRRDDGEDVVIFRGKVVNRVALEEQKKSQAEASGFAGGFSGDGN